MNLNDLDKQIKKIKEKAEKEIIVLKCQYAKDHSTVKVGDIVTDHIGSIKVDGIKASFGFSNDVPSCVYFGPEITKKGVLFKNGSTRSVYQVNLKNG